jgi:predicted HicB family RNase H-like nuclease
MAPQWRYHGTMDLRIYIDSVQQQLMAAAEAGGEDARALAERLIAPLEAAVRLTIQDALAAAAEEITRELAPGSVELRLRGRDPEFVVTAPPAEASGERFEDEPGLGPAIGTRLGAGTASGDPDDDAMSRINLRLPDRLKTRIEQAAGREGLSANAWLVRAAGVAIERTDPGRQRERPTAHGSQRYSGWAR